ncbi:alpha/beta fold hydrolase [Actinosynnema sp. NPDC004786]
MTLVEDGAQASEKVSNVPDDAELARSLDGDFRSAHVTVDGLRLHYVAGGTGRPLLLLPGYPQTWWEFRKVMPALAAGGRRVVAVDLPGMGGSDKPATGYDKKSIARVLLGFVRALGHEQVDVAGHDIGSIVAFAFAANHPEAVRKVAMLDVVHPDGSMYEIRMLPTPGFPFYPWWFAFNQVPDLPEKLLAGRTRVLVDWMMDSFLVDRTAVSDRDRAVFARRLDSPEAIHGAKSYYAAFGQDIEDLKTYGKVTAPVLGMVSDLGDGLFAAQMRATLPTQATDVEIVPVPGAGHYFVEEAPQAVIDAFTRFFD